MHTRNVCVCVCVRACMTQGNEIRSLIIFVSCLQCTCTQVIRLKIPVSNLSNCQMPNPILLQVQRKSTSQFVYCSRSDPKQNLPPSCLTSQHHCREKLAGQGAAVVLLLRCGQDRYDGGGVDAGSSVAIALALPETSLLMRWMVGLPLRLYDRDCN